MSDLTPCNYCELRRLKRRYGEANIRTVSSTRFKTAGIAVQRRARSNVHPAGVWVDLGVYFAALTDHCVC